MLVAMALADRDYSAVDTALHEIATQKLGHASNRIPTNIALKAAHGLWREVANDAAVAIELLFAVVQQPVADQGWNAALLAAPLSVECVGRAWHGGSFVAAAEGRAAA